MFVNFKNCLLLILKSRYWLTEYKAYKRVFSA